MSEISARSWTMPEDVWTLPDERKAESHEFALQVVNDVTTFSTLESEWDDLVEGSAATVFQTYDWQFLWWKHFADRSDCHLFLLLVRDGEKLVGIAPLYIQSFSILGFRMFRRLKFLGGGLESSKLTVLSLERDGPADYLDIIIAKGFEDPVSRILADFLQDKSYMWDEMYFQNVPEDALLLTQLLPLLRESGCILASVTSDACLKVDLPETYEGYLAALKKKVRQHFRHAYRAYADNPQFATDDLLGNGKIDGALEVLAQLHQKRWNAVGYPGLFSDKRFESLHNDVAKVFARKNRLWFKALRKGGKTVAVELGYKFNGRMYPYTSGIDRDKVTDSASSSPGLYMKLLVISEGIREGYNMVDLSRGGESYKYDMTSKVTHNSHITARFPSARSGSRKLAFGMVGSFNTARARVSCEIGIMKVIAKQKGSAFILPDYLHSLRQRSSFDWSGLFNSVGMNKLRAAVKRNHNENIERSDSEERTTDQSRQQESVG